jgi:hypothetical protein
LPLFTITYRDELGRAPETVEADRADTEPAHGLVVLRRAVLVIGQPREVVVRRLHAADLRSLERVKD